MDDDDRARRIGGGKSNMRGTPQGGVVSPLLANIYMNRFLKYWRLTGRGEAFRAHVIAYADDFVILSRGCAAEAMAWMKVVMTRLGLTLNEAKTSLKNARQERFDFLGYSFGPHRYKANGLWYLRASPSKKSMQRFKMKVGNLLVPGNNDPWPAVRDTRHAEQVSAGRTTSVTGRADRHSAALTDTSMSACATSSSDGTRWQGVAHGGSPSTWSMENVVCCVSNACPNGTAVCLTVKPVGEPDALIGHVRFDERGWETERCRMAQATAPILDSTIASIRTHALNGRYRMHSGHSLKRQYAQLP